MIPAKRYNPFGVEVYMRNLIEIAEAEKLASRQTVRNWVDKYGKCDDGVEQMLIEKFGIRNAYQLQRKIEDPTCDVKYKEVQNEILHALGYDTQTPTETTEDAVPDMSETEKEILDAMNARAAEEAANVKSVQLISEEPVENVPDTEDLRLVNRLIRDLAKVKHIPGFGIEIFDECVETLTAARSIAFDRLIDWDALASR